ncbi:hypothetical protein BJ165DRAFT_1532360 [Panaeolus papilionaceus]|nr:hypothetical protein BJ165DRAFT_1532360 [Panaeolus papilionaceus]
MQLPVEVFDLLFGLLVDDPSGPDIETMKACNLASSSIAAICERHLYSSLYFCIHSAKSRVRDTTCCQLDRYYARCQISPTKFASIQTKKSHVNRYVRRLGIIVHDEKPWKGGKRRREWWRTIKEVLLQLHLDKIQVLKLHTNSTIVQQVDPSVIGGPITKILKSPVLHTLYVHNILNFPSRQLHVRASGLRVLDIGFTTEDVEGPSTSSTFPPPPKLDSLTLSRGSEQKIVTLASNAMKLDEYPSFDLVSLSTFSMTMSTQINPQDVALGCLILDRTSNLKVLTLQSTNKLLDVSPTSRTLSSAIEKHSATLQTLVLTWTFTMTRRELGLLSHIPEFLGFTSTFKTLSTICLQILIMFLGEESLWDESDWNRLGDVLSHFPALRLVQVMRLPAEVFDLIFGFMTDGPSGPDIETIKACNLASSSISLICERYLYSSIYFCIHSARSRVKDSIYCQPDPYYARCQISATKFASIQANKPLINRYVRRLGIIVHDEEIWEKKRNWWNCIKEILLQLHLDKIQVLMLHTHLIGVQQVDPSIIEGPIVDILKSPLLQTLRVHNILKFPSHHLHERTTGIRDLDVGFTPIYETGPSTSSTVLLVPLKVESLTLRWGCQQRMIGLSSSAQNLRENSPFDFASLSSFSMFMTQAYRDEDVALSCLILDRTNNLEALMLESTSNLLDVSQTSRTLSSAIEKHSTTLQTLVLTWTYFTTGNELGLLSNIPKFLDFSSTLYTLSSVHLQILVILAWKECLWEENEWSRLGDALSRFPALRLVQLFVGPNYLGLLTEQACAERFAYLKEGQDILLKRLAMQSVAVEFSFAVKYSLR